MLPERMTGYSGRRARSFPYRSRLKRRYRPPTKPTTFGSAFDTRNQRIDRSLEDLADDLIARRIRQPLRIALRAACVPCQVIEEVPIACLPTLDRACRLPPGT